MKITEYVDVSLVEHPDKKGWLQAKVLVKKELFDVVTPTDENLWIINTTAYVVGNTDTVDFINSSNEVANAASDLEGDQINNSTENFHRIFEFSSGELLHGFIESGIDDDSVELDKMLELKAPNLEIFFQVEVLGDNMVIKPKRTFYVKLESFVASFSVA